MNYRHAFHAGNFADVVKHLTLVAVLLHLRRKEAPFAVIDTHAGRGAYDLKSDAAMRTGEWTNGIGRLGSLNGNGALAEYLKAARSDDIYPGSPLIAASLLRPQDRLVVIEQQPEEAAALRSVLSRFPRAKAEEDDGYRRLSALLPPPERRGAVLIDPPYESTDEFAAAAEALRTALKRFATGIYLLWFPVKSKAQADAFAGEVANTGAAKALRIDVDLGAIPAASDGKERLRAAGLIVVNPPFGLAAEMTASLKLIAPLLSNNAKFKVGALTND